MKTKDMTNFLLWLDKATPEQVKHEIGSLRWKLEQCYFKDRMAEYK
jgi:hypothetical protein